MNPVTLGALPLATRNASGSADKRRRSPFEHLRDVRQICRQVFGIPDYERYLAHMAARHPGRPVLSRRAYCALAIERKYGQGGPRCC